MLQICLRDQKDRESEREEKERGREEEERGRERRGEGEGQSKYYDDNDAYYILTLEKGIHMVVWAIVALYYSRL